MNINKNVLDKLDECVLASFNNNEIPVGAVIFNDEGIVSSGLNTRQMDHNVLGHAEINAILEAENKINDWRLDGFFMIVNLEPCDMCYSIINECRIDKVFYFIESDKKKSLRDDSKFINISNLISDYECKYRELLTLFFNKKR